MNHSCRGKTRFLAREEKHVKLGFMIFQKTWAAQQRSAKKRSQDDFEKSSFYKVFVDFGSYLLEINAVKPMEFVQFLIKHKLPVDAWSRPSIYETYIQELAKVESPDAALERSMEIMEKWGRDTGNDWKDFFKLVAPAQAVLWIKSGRISPWLLYTAATSQDLLNRMSEEQLAITHSVMDPKFWSKRISHYAKEAEAMRDILEEAGL